jgi:hypothetical protein
LLTESGIKLGMHKSQLKNMPGIPQEEADHLLKHPYLQAEFLDSRLVSFKISSNDQIISKPATAVKRLSLIIHRAAGTINCTSSNSAPNDFA